MLTHGFTVDAQGRKMSKSIGNTIEPQKVIDQMGADVLRLWIASTDYRGEIAVSDEILKRSGDVYRRLRNTARFLLANLDGFDPAHHVQPLDAMVALDRWIVHRAYELQQKLDAAYARYDFAEVVQSLANFCSVDLGSLYLDVTKDRLYTMPAESAGRRSAQTAMYHLAEAFVRWIAPILTFTADEMWRHLPSSTATGRRTENVLFATWYDGLAPLPADAALDVTKFDRLLALRERVSRELEPMRAAGEIGAALEAEILLGASQDDLAWLQPLQDELRFLFISGDVAVQGGSDVVQARRTEKPKCARCWQYRADVGAVLAHTDDLRPLRRQCRRHSPKPAAGSDRPCHWSRNDPHRPSNALAWLLLSVVVVVVDQLTKLWVLRDLPEYTAVPVIPGFWNWYRTYNTGAAFSLLSSAGGWQKYLFLAFAVAISGVLATWLAKTPRGAWRTAAPYALIIGGAIGNVIDRLVHGHVVDFIQWHVGDHYWPSFNVADSAIVVGVVGILLAGLLPDRQVRAGAKG